MKKVLKKKNLMHNFMDDIIQIICKMIQCSNIFFVLLFHAFVFNTVILCLNNIKKKGYISCCKEEPIFNVTVKL